MKRRNGFFFDYKYHITSLISWKRWEEVSYRGIEGEIEMSIGDVYRTIGHLFRWTHDGELKAESRQKRVEDRCLLFRSAAWALTVHRISQTYGCSKLNSAHRAPRAMHRRISPLCVVVVIICVSTSTEFHTCERTKMEIWKNRISQSLVVNNLWKMILF